MIKFDSKICGDFEESTNREWLETNGIGGFASSTISGAHTRRYHGLLTAAMRPPLGRVTLLSKFEETLSINDQSFPLSTNRYKGAVEPEGFRFLKSFSLSPFPTWIYEFEDIEIQKTLFMVYGENTTVCRWSILSRIGGRDRYIALKLEPLFSFVDYHELQHEADGIDFTYETRESGDILVNGGKDFPALRLANNATTVTDTGFWYRDFEYSWEQARGFDFTEDLYQPFALEFDLRDDALVISSTEKQKITAASRLESEEKTRRKQLVEIAGAKDKFSKQLVLAADQFIVKRGEGHTIIAGYPWFSDWGRDTMIALSGLTLATNREGIAKTILLEFSKHISQGMIPNRFPDDNAEPEYNTVDGSLWYFEAIRAYAAKTEDYEFVEESLYEGLVEIIYWHSQGTRFRIRVDEDGLLMAGEGDSQLTWMDARVGDEVFTPRHGKAVEIQALWFNALQIMCDFADQFGDNDGRHLYSKMAKQVKSSFNSKFWNQNEQCLYDVIDGEKKDSSIRPNQLFAVSLNHSMLSLRRAAHIVRKVEKFLFTPTGIRSLAPTDRRYHGNYGGTPYERDSAYHQGTSWGWLIGAFIDGVRRTSPIGRKSNRYVEEILSSLMAHLEEAGVGQISEIFDGDEPHAPNGCYAQAWSVAEILRVIK